jgi:hypothetical protein
VRRPAVIGDVAIASDSLVQGYLEEYVGDGAGPSLKILVEDLQALANDNPVVMRFLRYVFKRFTVPQSPCASEDDFIDEPYDDSVEVHRDEDGWPLAFSNLPESGPVINAWHNAIYEKIQKLKWGHWRNCDDNRAVVNLVERTVDGWTRHELVDYFATYYGWGGSSNGAPSQDLLEFMVNTFDKLVRILEDWSTGWKADDRDDASYFAERSFDQQEGGLERQSKCNKAEHSGDSKPRDNRPCCNKPKGPLKKEYRHEYLDRPFRFLDLAPELRNRIYKYALLPGTISLRSCGHHMPVGTAPGLGTGLLATCKQIHKEADGMLLENHIIADALLYNGVRTVLHPHQLPSHILPKSTHLSLVLDSTTDGKFEVKSDFRQLQALTSLKHLRVTGFALLKHPWTIADWRWVLSQIITRVPASCIVEYGFETKEEKAHLHAMARTIEGTVWKSRSDTVSVVEVSKDLWRAAADGLQGVVAGEKSGVQSTRAFGLERM